MTKMMMNIRHKIKKILLGFGLLGILFFSGFSGYITTQAVKVQIPEGNRESDVMVKPQESQIQTGEKDIFELIQIINKYLRFSIGAISLIGIIISGFRLLTSEGDEEANKKTSKMLLGASIGLWIAMLSYAIVKLIVNLF